MLPTDPLTKTDIFQFDIVTRQLAANVFLVAFAATLVGLRFVARRLRETNVWYVNGDLNCLMKTGPDKNLGGMMLRR
jgi:hypothetical protein